jgi:RNA polymerase sigma factor (sigma-70 family)
MTASPDWDVVTDAELVCAAAAGDRAAFGSIYARYADRLHDFCITMVRDDHAAADCVQEVFCTAAGRFRLLRDPDKLRPWLYSIARNEALRCIRERKRERTSDDLPDNASDDPTPDVLAGHHELADLVAEVEGGLSDRDRMVLDLTYRHQLSGPELAETLGVSHVSAKKMVERLRDTVERTLGAVLVARRARGNPRACTELGEMLDGWDGRFTVLMRKRVVRHIESCPVCDDERRRLVDPVALLGGAPAFISAPTWLRDATLDRVDLPSGTSDASAWRRRAGRTLVVAAVVAGVVSAGATLIVHLHHSTAVNPAGVSRTDPPRSTTTSSVNQPEAPLLVPRSASTTTATPTVTATSPETAPASAASPPESAPRPVEPRPGPNKTISPAPSFAPPPAPPIPPSRPVVTAPPPIKLPPRPEPSPSPTRPVIKIPGPVSATPKPGVPVVQ